MDLAGFHRFQQERLKHWPYSMNATSTHDTKRSEDVRARINVLSEIPGEWEKRLLRWQRLNQKHKTLVNGIAVPTPVKRCCSTRPCSAPGLWIPGRDGFPRRNRNS